MGISEHYCDRVGRTRYLVFKKFMNALVGSVCEPRVRLLGRHVTRTHWPPCGRESKTCRRPIKTFSTNKQSMSVFRNVSIASWGVLTMGCPFTLKLVFSTISLPVVLPTA